MTEQEIQQRLLAAALMDEVAIPTGLEDRLKSVLKKTQTDGIAQTKQKPLVIPLRRAGRAAAAATIVAAVAIPTAKQFEHADVRFTDTCQNAEEARHELQDALATIQLSPSSNELFNLVQ